jgi:hypothetical protein
MHGSAVQPNCRHLCRVHEECICMHALHWQCCALSHLSTVLEMWPFSWQEVCLTGGPGVSRCGTGPLRGVLKAKPTLWKKHSRYATLNYG